MTEVFHKFKYIWVPPALFFPGEFPTIHKFMATVEIHGAMTFILVIKKTKKQKTLSVSSISQCSPQNKFLAAPWGGVADASMTGVRAAWDWSGTLEGLEGWVCPVCHSSCHKALPARPDSFDIAHQILGQAYPKNLRKEEKESQTVKCFTSLGFYFSNEPHFSYLWFLKLRSKIHILYNPSFKSV